MTFDFQYRPPLGAWQFILAGLILLCLSTISCTQPTQTILRDVVFVEGYVLQSQGFTFSTGETIVVNSDGSTIAKADVYFQGVDSTHIKVIAHPLVTYIPSTETQVGLLRVYEDTAAVAIQMLQDTSLSQILEVPTTGYVSSVTLTVTTPNTVCAVVTRQNLYAIFKISDYLFGYPFKVTAKVQRNGSPYF